MNFALYVHIPFCKKKCAYCDFPSYAGKDELMPQYIDALKSEIGYISSIYDKPRISSVFVGGGTPTMLNEALVHQLFEAIRSNFDVEKGAEITIEANPGTVTREKMQALKGEGVNRISLGAQSFDDAMLKKLGRIHLAHEITDAYSLIRETGFKNVNLDLIFAAPGESLKDWTASLDKAIALKPEHISIYNLSIEEGTPLFREKEEGALILPDEEEELAMYTYAIRTLKSAGFIHYEISNFAKKGFECVHNITYWTMKDYIGVGAGAHSFIEGKRIENSPFLETYLSADMSKIKKEHLNTKKENMQEMIFLGLRMLDGFHLEDFTGKFGISFREIYKKEIAELTEDGLLAMDGKNVKLTENGLYLANEVFKKFL